MQEAPNLVWLDISGWVLFNIVTVTLTLTVTVAVEAVSKKPKK